MKNLSHLKFHYLLSLDGTTSIAIAMDGGELIILSPLNADKTRYDVKSSTKDIFDVVKEYADDGFMPQGYIEFDILLTEFGSELIIP